MVEIKVSDFSVRWIISIVCIFFVRIFTQHSSMLGSKQQKNKNSPKKIPSKIKNKNTYIYAEQFNARSKKKIIENNPVKKKNNNNSIDDNYYRYIHQIINTKSIFKPKNWPSEQCLRKINVQVVQMLKNCLSHRLLKLRTVNCHARVTELGLQI